MGSGRVGEGGWGDTLQTGVEIISEMIGRGSKKHNPTAHDSPCAGHKARLDSVCVCVSLSALYLSYCNFLSVDG